MQLEKKNVIPVLFLVLLFFLTILTVNTVKLPKTYKSSASEIQAKPRMVKISNLRPGGLTISYLTETKAIGRIKYGAAAENLEKTALDARGENTESTIHYFEINNAGENQSIYFKICSSSCEAAKQYGVALEQSIFEDNFAVGGLAAQQRLPVPAEEQKIPPLPLFGEASLPDGALGKPEAVVYAKLWNQNKESSLFLSSLAQTSQNDRKIRYALDLANARTADTLEIFPPDRNTGRLSLEIIAEGFYRVAIDNLDLSRVWPVPPLQLATFLPAPHPLETIGPSPTPIVTNL